MKSLALLFTNRRALTVFLLGFASGLPLALTGSTLQAWLTDEQFDVKAIGWFMLVSLPYTWKFIWAPILDRYKIPVLGRRRGWIISTQIILIVCIAAMGMVNPRQEFYILAVFAVAIAFFSSTQDIAIDAYTVEVLKPEERGVGSGLNVMGYRIAMLVSGGGALILADKYAKRPLVILEGGKIPGNFELAYVAMAILMVVGVIAVLIGPEPTVEEKPPRTMREAVVEPFIEFFKRKGAWAMLAFVVLYKFDWVLTNAFSTRFFMEIGFSKTEIGVVYKGFGFFATLAGTLGGGVLLARWGVNRSLWIFGAIQAVTTAAYIAVTVLGKNYAAMVFAIGAENFAGGLANAALVAFLMGIANLKYTATQYALLTSAAAVARIIANVPAGYMISALGWHWFYVVCILTGIPGLYMLSRFAPWPGFSVRRSGR